MAVSRSKRFVLEKIERIGGEQLMQMEPPLCIRRVGGVLEGWRCVSGESCVRGNEKKSRGGEGRNRRNAVISTRRDCISLLIRRVKKKLLDV